MKNKIIIGSAMWGIVLGAALSTIFIGGCISLPEAVKLELLSKPEGGKLLKDNSWIMNRKVKGETVNVLQVFLDQGEAEAIALAKERGDSLLIDERRGRKIAFKMDIRVRGTLGALLEAKNSGIIESVGDSFYDKIPGNGS